MPKHLTEPESVRLADEIRASEPGFIDAATRAFRERFEMEYYRLRGYAVEAGKDKISLNVTVICSFNPSDRWVLIESAPTFQPKRERTKLDLPPGATHDS